MTLSKTKFTYNDKSQKPTVVVKDSKGKTIPSSNYNVSYSKGCKNVGVYKITITFKENYSGNITKSFKITKADQKIKASNFEKNTGSSSFFVKAKLSKGNGKLTYKSSNAKVAKVSSKGKVTIKGVGKATITITASSTKNYKKTTKKITITVNPKGVSISSLSAKVGQFTVKWKKNSSVTGYQIRYSTKNSMENSVKKTIAGKNKDKKVVKGLSAGKKYYVQLRTYKTVNGVRYYSSWSSKKTVTTRTKPNFSVFMSDDWGKGYWILMHVTNNGNKPITFYSKGAHSIDSDYDIYDRDLTLADVNDAGTDIEIYSSVTVYANSSGMIMWYTPDKTWIDEKTTVFYYFKYDGVEYHAFSSSYYGTKLLDY